MVNLPVRAWQTHIDGDCGFQILLRGSCLFIMTGNSELVQENDEVFSKDDIDLETLLVAHKTNSKDTAFAVTL